MRAQKTNYRKSCPYQIKNIFSFAFLTFARFHHFEPPLLKKIVHAQTDNYESASERTRRAFISDVTDVRVLEFTD